MNKRANLCVGVVFLIRTRVVQGVENRLYRVLDPGAGGAGQQASPRTGSGYLLYFAAFYPDRLLIERIDLVEPDNLRFIGEAMAICAEFITDHAVGARDIFE